MAVDPGETTGVAQAFLAPSECLTTEALFERCLEKRSIRVAHVVGGKAQDAPGYDFYHVRALLSAWERFVFKAHVEYGLPIDCIYLVFEDFQLRQRSANLSPVQVTAGFECLLAGRHRIVKQSASEAKGYATDARLRKWGLWTVGKEHGRDATRHLALRASKILQGDL